MQQLHFRSIWISDTHLGGKGVKSAELHEFLKNTESAYLYLVGDILDLRKLKRRWHWPEINTRVVNLILRKARQGTKVYYLPGNHDAMLCDYCGGDFNGVTVCSDIIHTAADGSRFLVLHGDQFDCVVQHSEWLANIGSNLYDVLLIVNRWYNALRKLRGLNHFSISAYLKHKCKKAVNCMGNFEQILLNEIGEHQVDGIICGHIHKADIKLIGRYLYSNSGDWVESCTALVENSHGTLGIVDWLEQNPINNKVPIPAYEKDRYRDRRLAPSN
jgi:UDP-2,3-diacylglucosamine pyrophosphatase LpxH